MSSSYLSTLDKCLQCNEVGEVCVITHVSSEPGADHHVGARLEVPIAALQRTHDLVRPPSSAEPLHILEEWSCPRCRSRQWIEMVIENGVIRSIKVVPFDSQTLDRLHFVTNLIVEFYEDMTGEPYYLDQKVRPDWQERLRPHLS